MIAWHHPEAIQGMRVVLLDESVRSVHLTGDHAAAQLVETDGVNLGHKATCDDVAANFAKIADFSHTTHYTQGGEQNAKFFARIQDSPLAS